MLAIIIIQGCQQCPHFLHGCLILTVYMSLRACNFHPTQSKASKAVNVHDYMCFIDNSDFKYIL